VHGARVKSVDNRSLSRTMGAPHTPRKETMMLLELGLLLSVSAPIGTSADGAATLSLAEAAFAATESAPPAGPVLAKSGGASGSSGSGSSKGSKGSSPGEGGYHSTGEGGFVGSGQGSKSPNQAIPNAPHNLPSTPPASPPASPPSSQ